MSTMQGEVAIVTGASRGIGHAVAEELARAGAAVVVNYKESEETAAALVERIESSGGKAAAFAADVSDEGDVKRLVDSAVRSFGGVDVLVCNAGIVRDQLAAAMSLAEWEDVIRVNLGGAFLCVRAVLPHMMGNKKGSIVALSSVAATRGGRGHANYAASKGGIDAMVRSLAVELAPKNIRINAVSPGVIETDMTKRIRNFAEDEILAAVPLGRYGEPEEVARAVRFLASSEASYITGAVLQVTGGFGA